MEIGRGRTAPAHGRNGAPAHRGTGAPTDRGAAGAGRSPGRIEQGELWAAPGPRVARMPGPGTAPGSGPAAAPARDGEPPAGAAIERFDYFLSEPDTTNNRMALRSAIAALALAGAAGGGALTFVTDSNYVVLGMTRWVHAWRARGWRRKGGPIENLDLWRELEAAAAGRGVEWRWVRGHAGHAKNEYANFLATRAAADQGISPGLVPSGFAAWLEAERARGRYARYDPDGELR